jgi:hypothetical protein
MSVAIRRPIIDGLDGVLTYFATVNPSNIQRYDYDRNVVALELRYWF